ncbi:WD40 repeat domain-containing protein [Saccharopolyspora spinosa]|uniref:WD40 repeat domain-containing protein n=1 Tax=Saccharopolyspora spinosa TaxID=60894 RepID=UPI000237A81E|nr:WD40 repeat domain-containing protein [Saccharopolyspora spinosa]
MPTRLPEPASSRVVLIGTSSYKELPNLPAVQRNLLALNDVLTDARTGGFASEHCTIVENPENPSAAYDPLDEAARAATNTLLVYFAGHGLVGPEADKLYLGLPGSTTDKPWINALDFDHVRMAMQNSMASNRILILDCCFSGRAVGDFMTPVGSAVAAATTVRGTVTLASSQSGMVSLAPKAAKYTAFTGELIRLLGSGIPDGPEMLPLDRIFGLLEHAMREQGRPTPTMRSTDSAGNLALTRNRAVDPTAPPWSDPVPARTGLPRRKMLKAAIGAGVLGLGAWGTYELTACSTVPESLPGPDRVETLAFSPTEDVLVAGYNDRTLRMWETRNWQEVARFDTGASVRSTAFSPDGRILAIGSRETVSKVLLWDVRTRQPIGAPLPAGHGEWVDGLAFDRRGTVLATSGRDSVVHLWDVAGQRRIGSLIGHGGAAVYGVAFHPRDDNTIATAGNDGTARLWDASSQRQVGDSLVHPAFVNDVAFSPGDGALLATACWDARVWLWDVSRRRPLDPPLKGHPLHVYRVAFRSDGLLASVGYANESWANRPLLWDVKTQSQEPLYGHVGTINDLSFNRHGDVLATAGWNDHAVRLWRLPARFVDE